MVSSKMAMKRIGMALNFFSVVHSFTPVSYTFTPYSSAGMSINPISQQSTLLTAMDVGMTDTLVDAWSSYNVALEELPLITKSITAGVILGAADLTGQAIESSTKEEEDKTSVDLGRALRFGFFGLVLQAPWNHFYYLLLDGVLPPTVDPFSGTTAIKVAIDQFVQAPIFTVLIFFFLGLLEGKTIDSVKKQLDNDYKDTMVANWKLWVPATAVNIAFCPPIFRVLFLNCVFFFWSIYLSLKLNKDEGGE